jgi:hypothetical protein
MPQINVQASIVAGETLDTDVSYPTLATVQRNWAVLFLTRPAPVRPSPRSSTRARVRA